MVLNALAASIFLYRASLSRYRGSKSGHFAKNAFLTCICGISYSSGCMRANLMIFGMETPLWVPNLRVNFYQNLLTHAGFMGINVLILYLGQGPPFSFRRLDHHLNYIGQKRYFFQMLPYMSPKRQKNISDFNRISYSHPGDISSWISMYFGVSCCNWLPVFRECKFFKQNIAYLLQLEKLNRMVYSKSNLDFPIKNKSRKTKKLGFSLVIKAFWSRNNFSLVLG